MTKQIPRSVAPGWAKEALLQAVKTTEIETIDLADARGRVLACEIRAKENIPPFDRSPLDGYTVRAIDTKQASKENPVTFPIQEEIPAGYVASEPIKPGFAVKLSTGSPIPEGCDAVIRFEDTVFTEKEVTIFAPVNSDSNIVHAGSDVEMGTLLMTPGRVLDAADLGILAGLGYPVIEVYKIPRIAIISTGDELVPVEAELTPGKIRNSSAYLLKGILEQNGFSVDLVGIVKDTLEVLTKALVKAMETCDIIMTTGGVSVGDYDYTLEAQKQAGAEVLFWGIAMKPGMATVAAVKADKLLIGLSGNPSAAAAALYLTVMPSLLRKAGRSVIEPEEIQVTFLDDFKKKSPGGRVIPGRLSFKNGTACISIRSRQENGMVGNWGGCNVLALVERGSGPITAGMTCKALYLG